MSQHGLAAAQEKMREGGVAEAAINTFTRLYGLLEGGASGFIRESDIAPLPDLPSETALEISSDEAAQALAQTAIIKLNGGLGTSMGLDKAKSLLPVRETPSGPLAFLDITIRQVLAAREATGARLPLIFMNSFSTQEDTLAKVAEYPGLAVDGLPVDFLQNREPKLRADTLEPVEWPANPAMEWCPPGHGDLYPALHASGVVRDLLAQGFRYASVSNSDNLGAAPNGRIAAWFAASGAPYAAEMSAKTPADVKGGQLVVRTADNQIVQRETAQTHPSDLEVSLDPTRHRYFHTNNLWFNLEALNAELERTGGALELPLIVNEKTVDPADPTSTPVIQLESAMGAAVAVFQGALAIVVERERFLPVKTTNDLLLLRSDVFALQDDYRLVAQVPAPLVNLSGSYKKIADFQERFAQGVPSIAGAESLTVNGDWTFSSGVTATGAATLPDPGTPSTVPAGATITESGITE
ncbi:MAG: UTP--glucose-1-phosphate uridylyltransferase [Cellulomonadaceae bacterium]|jgi:UTP--glucose-1-phosphate uridylyltransferase|nr:UTP--glucose-1-phosphate uridylyltransferase [Cellulomonadaceae bacterium]